MRKMKDSGIEWIGMIPENVNILRNKYLISYVKGKLPANINTEKEGIPYIGASDLEDLSGNCTYTSYTTDTTLPLCSEEDVLILWDGARAGLIGTNHKGAVASTVVNAIPKHTINKKFWYWYLKAFQAHLYNRVNGTTIPHMNTDYIEEIAMLDWTIEDQEKIATYLDQKCVEIDAIIAAKEKTNELLKEFRQSIIYEAVTKGLDPTVSMKDSGIEWIGEIPESWDTCKLKYAVECRTEKTVDKSASVAYIGLEHVKSDFGVLVDEYKHIWDFEGDTIDFKLGDVLFGKLRPYLAKAWSASFNGKCSSEFWVMTPIKLTSKFLLYTVLSNHFIANIDHSTFGVKMPRAEWEYAGNQLICCPSIAEQENITEYLDLKCSEIDSLISENAESIEMLKEYRQSVIYEAVTGKVEIKNV